MIEAVVFDLDGILIDSEHVWDEVRQQLAEERGGRWNENASRDMMGMSSLEWSRYMRDVVGLTEEPEEISAEVVRRLEDRYRRELPLIAGAEQAVERIAERWPLALASSSNRELIDLVLESSGLGRYFEASVSSEEVARGKPAPDVFLEAARRLGAEPTRCAAVEDSENGILAAKAAGMRTIAIPNPQYPPHDDALAAADAVLATIEDLAPAVVDPQIRFHGADSTLRNGQFSPCRRGRRGRSRCGRRAPSRSRARRVRPPRAPRSARSRGRTPGPGSRS